MYLFQPPLPQLSLPSPLHPHRRRHPWPPRARSPCASAPRSLYATSPPRPPRRSSPLTRLSSANPQQPSLCGLEFFFVSRCKSGYACVCVAWFERKVSAICLRDAEHNVSSSSQRAKAFSTPMHLRRRRVVCRLRSLREVTGIINMTKSWKKLFCFPQQKLGTLAISCNEK